MQPCSQASTWGKPGLTTAELVGRRLDKIKKLHDANPGGFLKKAA